jgi:quinolinate synthase
MSGDGSSLTLESVKKRLYERLHPSLMAVDIEAHAEKVHRILILKEKHEVLMLGHNYMEPLIFNLSEQQEQGDSLGLSMNAAKTEAPYIVFNGVPFMAETAKVLSPNKRVLVADKSAGCSLADDFGAEEVKKLKAIYPGVPVMIYVNSYADAKAESDICCTIFVPDIFFAQNLEEELKDEKTVIYPGKDNGQTGAVCEVHEKFALQDILAVRQSFDIPKGCTNRVLYVHWECRPEVLRESDFYGSTSQIRRDIAKRVEENRLERAFIASECELTSNLMQEFPSVQFWTACSVRCSHMAKVTIDKVLSVMEALDAGSDLSQYEISLGSEVIERARRPIQRMLSFAD